MAGLDDHFCPSQEIQNCGPVVMKIFRSLYRNRSETLGSLSWVAGDVSAKYDILPLGNPMCKIHLSMCSCKNLSLQMECLCNLVPKGFNHA